MSDLTTLTLDTALAEVAEWIAAVNYEQAIARCNELTASHPDAVRVLRARAQARELWGDVTAAIDDYTRVLDIVPADVRAMVGLARCKLIAEQAGEAAVIARQALDHDPKDADALEISGDTDEAGDPKGEVAIARSRFSAGMSNRAMTGLRRMSDAQPDRTDMQVILAEFMWRSGLKITTTELCQTVLDAQPDCLNAHAILSALWTQIGNTELAELHTRAVDRLDPDHREMQDWLGDVSPFPVRDVPAFTELAQPEPNVAEERVDDERERSAWVDDLIAAASPVTTAAGPAQPVNPVHQNDDPYAGEVAGTSPLEWMPVEADDAVGEEDVPAWLTSLRADANKPDATEAVTRDSGARLQTSAASRDPLDTDFVVAPLEWAPNETVDTRPAQTVSDAPPVGQAQPAEPVPDEAPAEVASESPAVPASAEATHVDNTPEPAPELPALQAESRKRVHKPVPRARKARLGNDELLSLARKAVEASRYDEAADFYTSLIASGKKLDTILADLDMATKAYPDVRRFHALLGDVYTRKGDVNAALMAYHRALDSN